jgi:hypothetical protein
MEGKLSIISRNCRRHEERGVITRENGGIKWGEKIENPPVQKA